MALAINNKSGFVNGTNSENGITESYNAGTGSDRVLVIFCGLVDNSLAIQSATYNGVAMTVFGVREEGQTSIAGAYLVNPAAGANDLSVTFGNDVGYTLFACYINGEPNEVEDTTQNGGTGTAMSVSGTIASGRDSLALAAFTHDTSTSMAAAGSENEEADFGTGSVNMGVYSVAHTTDGTKTMNITADASDDWQGAQIIITEAVAVFTVDTNDSVSITENVSVAEAFYLPGLDKDEPLTHFGPKLLD